MPITNQYSEMPATYLLNKCVKKWKDRDDPRPDKLQCGDSHMLLREEQATAGPYKSGN